jgi:hypothetical protein
MKSTACKASDCGKLETLVKRIYPFANKDFGDMGEVEVMNP